MIAGVDFLGLMAKIKSDDRILMDSVKDAFSWLSNMKKTYPLHKQDLDLEDTIQNLTKKPKKENIQSFSQSPLNKIDSEKTIESGPPINNILLLKENRISKETENFNGHEYYHQNYNIKHILDLKNVNHASENRRKSLNLDDINLSSDSSTSSLKECPPTVVKKKISLPRQSLDKNNSKKKKSTDAIDDKYHKNNDECNHENKNESNILCEANSANKLFGNNNIKQPEINIAKHKMLLTNPLQSTQNNVNSHNLPPFKKMPSVQDLTAITLTSTASITSTGGLDNKLASAQRNKQLFLESRIQHLKGIRHHPKIPCSTNINNNNQLNVPTLTNKKTILNTTNNIITNASNNHRFATTKGNINNNINNNNIGNHGTGSIVRKSIRNLKNHSKINANVNGTNVKNHQGALLEKTNKPPSLFLPGMKKTETNSKDVRDGKGKIASKIDYPKIIGAAEKNALNVVSNNVTAGPTTMLKPIGTFNKPPSAAKLKKVTTNADLKTVEHDIPISEQQPKNVENMNSNLPPTYKLRSSIDKKAKNDYNIHLLTQAKDLPATSLPTDSPKKPEVISLTTTPNALITTNLPKDTKHRLVEKGEKSVNNTSKATNATININYTNNNQSILHNTTANFNVNNSLYNNNNNSLLGNKNTINNKLFKSRLSPEEILSMYKTVTSLKMNNANTTQNNPNNPMQTQNSTQKNDSITIINQHETKNSATNNNNIPKNNAVNVKSEVDMMENNDYSKYLVSNMEKGKPLATKYDQVNSHAKDENDSNMENVKSLNPMTSKGNVADINQHHLATNVQYDIESMRSDDSSDDESNPKKPRPPWAFGPALKEQAMYQENCLLKSEWPLKYFKGARSKVPKASVLFGSYKRALKRKLMATAQHEETDERNSLESKPKILAVASNKNKAINLDLATAGSGDFYLNMSTQGEKNAAGQNGGGANYTMLNETVGSEDVRGSSVFWDTTFLE